MSLRDIFKMKLSSLVGNHLTKIDSGKHRDVYRINTHHFDVGNKNYKGKILKYDEDLQVNIDEINTWQHVKGTKFEKFFCPIRDVSSGRKYILMDRVEVLGKQNNYQEILRDMREVAKRDMELSNADAEQMYGLDIHRQNVGYHKGRGRHVFIDYPWGGRFSTGFFIEEDASTIKDINDITRK